MRQKLARFWQLPGSEKYLLVEALAHVLATRVALLTRRSDGARIRVSPIPLPCAPITDGRTIAWAVTVVATRIPGATCLTQALAGREMLRRRGVASEIRLGVAMEDEFKAHAWLLRDGVVLLGGSVDTGYTELGTLPDL